MSYKDCHRITPIRGNELNNLSISWDYKDESNDLSKRTAVLLFTPNMGDSSEHFHIGLNQKEARELKDWLSSYFN